MRALAGVVLLTSATAFAQPAEPPPPPPSDSPVEQPPADGQQAAPDASAEGVDQRQEGDAQPEPNVTYAYGPLDEEGWPRGFNQEDLRGLPECGPDGLPREYGAPIGCRPHLVRFAPSWAIGFDYTTGAAFGNVPTAGGVHGWGVDTHFGFGRNLQLGARYEMLGISVARSPGEGEHAKLAQHMFASARFRLWTDEAARNAFTLGAGAGLGVDRQLGGVSPMVRASLARETGLFFKRHASLFAFELAYERSLSDPGIRTFLASLRTGAEVNVVTPKNLDERQQPSRHITTIHMLMSAWWGLGISLGIPLVGPLRLETTGDFLTNVTDAFPHFRAYEGAQWSARTGLRLNTGILYFLGQAGMSWYAHDPKGDLDRVVHGEFGFDINMVTLGGWVRWNLDDSFDSAGLVVSLVFGGGRWGAHVPPLYMEREYVSVGGGGGASVNVNTNVGVDVDANVDANANVDVHVDVKPVVIEVPLGASVFGVGVSIDPRILSIDKLRGAGFVQVELSGPAGALADFRGQLSGTLDSRGVHVDGWATVETSARIVRAKFTIWPPGTRPPAP